MHNQKFEINQSCHDQLLNSPLPTPMAPQGGAHSEIFNLILETQNPHSPKKNSETETMWLVDKSTL